MLFHRLKASGLLSFGPKGIDLELRNLNVLIGPNGSGKSNVLELLSLFRAAPAPQLSIAGPMLWAGGPTAWMWKGERRPESESTVAQLSCEIELSHGLVRHQIAMRATPDALRLVDEIIEDIQAAAQGLGPFWHYRMNLPGKPTQAGVTESPDAWDNLAILPEGEQPYYSMPHDRLDFRLSILAQIRDPARLPEFHELEHNYQAIALHRDWVFGPTSPMRQPARLDQRSDSVSSGGRNLTNVAAELSANQKKKLVAALQSLYPGIENLHVYPAAGGALQLFIEEQGGMEIPASRLSDGTLRYLLLLLILLDPAPPPLIAIEEPELGLHPDVIPEVASLLVEASERTQLVVTTHSRLLIDCLGGNPECVIVCEKHDGETVLQRLEADRLKAWLETYSLGDLWSKGELGGNRW